MVNYFQELLQAIKDAWKNLLIILPYILQGVAVIIVGLILMVITGVILLPMAALNLDQLLTNPESVSIAWTTSLIVTGSILLFIDFLILYSISVWFNAGIFTMINDVAEGKKAEFSSFMKGANSNFAGLFMLQLLTALIYLVALSPMLLFILLAIPATGARVLMIILAVMFFILFLILAFFLSAAFFFSIPIIIRERIGAWHALSKSARTLFRQPSHTFITFLLFVALIFVVGIATGILRLPIGILAQVTKNALFYSLDALLNLARALVSWFFTIAGFIFTFRMYKLVQGDQKS